MATSSRVSALTRLAMMSCVIVLFAHVTTAQRNGPCASTASVAAGKPVANTYIYIPQVNFTANDFKDAKIACGVFGTPVQLTFMDWTQNEGDDVHDRKASRKLLSDMPPGQSVKVTISFDPKSVQDLEDQCDVTNTNTNDECYSYNVFVDSNNKKDSWCLFKGSASLLTTAAVGNKASTSYPTSCYGTFIRRVKSVFTGEGADIQVFYGFSPKLPGAPGAFGLGQTSVSNFQMSNCKSWLTLGKTGTYDNSPCTCGSTTTWATTLDSDLKFVSTFFPRFDAPSSSVIGKCFFNSPCSLLSKRDILHTVGQATSACKQVKGCVAITMAYKGEISFLRSAKGLISRANVDVTVVPGPSSMTYSSSGIIQRTYAQWPSMTTMPRLPNQCFGTLVIHPNVYSFA